MARRHAGARLCVTICRVDPVVRRRVARLGLDTSHFTGQRMVATPAHAGCPQARSWSALLVAIGVKSTSRGDRTRVKAHALRLGLDLSHLVTGPQAVHPTRAALRNLRTRRQCSPHSWFSLCGFGTAIPVEPTVYDLLVSMPDGIKRVQVKTTTYNSKTDGRSRWAEAISVGNGSDGSLRPRTDRLVLHRRRRPHHATSFRVRSSPAGSQILLRTYTRYIVGSAAGLMARSQAA